jgi:hypothetical protein
MALKWSAYRTTPGRLPQSLLAWYSSLCFEAPTLVRWSPHAATTQCTVNPKSSPLIFAKKVVASSGANRHNRCSGEPQVKHHPNKTDGNEKVNNTWIPFIHEYFLRIEGSQVEENQLSDAESGKGWHDRGQGCLSSPASLLEPLFPLYTMPSAPTKKPVDST